jgi:cytochrome c556
MRTIDMMRTTAFAMLAAFAVAAPAQEGPTFQEIMQGLGEDMNRVATGIFMEDFAAIERAAEAVAHHPRPSSAEHRRIVAAVGPDVERFRSVDQAVHGGAEGMLEAARARDMDGVLHHHGEVMRGCVACHTAFRARLTPSSRDTR